MHFFFSNLITFIPSNPKWSIKIDKSDCPNKPKARVNDTPSFEKLRLLKTTVKTPMAPALYSI